MTVYISTQFELNNILNPFRSTLLFVKPIYIYQVKAGSPIILKQPYYNASQ